MKVKGPPSADAATSPQKGEPLRPKRETVGNWPGRPGGARLSAGGSGDSPDAVGRILTRIGACDITRLVSRHESADQANPIRRPNPEPTSAEHEHNLSVDIFRSKCSVEKDSPCYAFFIFLFFFF